jgi:hypothetical protein
MTWEDECVRKTLLGSTAAPPPPPRIEPPPHTKTPSRPAPSIAHTPRARHRAKRERRRAHGQGREERDDGDGDGSDPPDGPPKRRDHHGDRTTPPPAQFSLAELADDCLLTEREVAAIGRWAVSTVETWRRRGHPLKWITIAGGFIRYRAADLRHFLASGQPRRRGRPATPAPKRTPAKRPAQYTKTAETHSQDSAPPRRRASSRPRTADGLAGAPSEPSS